MRLALLFIPVCVFCLFCLVWFFLWLSEEVLTLLFFLHCDNGDFSILMKYIVCSSPCQVSLGPSAASMWFCWLSLCLSFAAVWWSYGWSVSIMDTTLRLIKPEPPCYSWPFYSCTAGDCFSCDIYLHRRHHVGNASHNHINSMLWGAVVASVRWAACYFPVSFCFLGSWWHQWS